MTKIKFCGLKRPCDIQTVNKLAPDYVGFVFAPRSFRYITPVQADCLKEMLSPSIKTVGVFVNEDIHQIASLIRSGIIDTAQLHGSESETDIARLQDMTGCSIIRAFRMLRKEDADAAENSCAGHILVDSGAGTGTVFNWNLLKNIRRPYFLAGGLTPENASTAVRQLHPFALDVSSGIETEGLKDPEKMAAFIAAVRKGEQNDKF